MKRILLGMVLIMAVVAVFAATGTAANRGPAEIDIFGGSRGKVPFPHAQHQDRLGDCNVCHSVFPQETDAIQTMKASGALASKQVMNAQCIKCHKAEKRAGKPFGPLTCKTCHVR